MNVGVILGDASQGLTDIDLDCAEATKLAPYVLPKTAVIFGRASRRASHWLYQTELAQTADTATIAFRDPTGTGRSTLVELRIGGGKGSQTVFPGSTHKTGELIEWEETGELEKVDGADLQRRVAQLAVCSLLTRYWPKEGGRHEAALVVGGFIARTGLNNGRTATLVEAIARAAGDSEQKDRRTAAQDAAEAHRAGKNAYGLTKLRKTFGDEIANSIAEWLGYSEAANNLETAQNVQPGASVNNNADDARPPAFTDEALALRFADQHADDLRYVADRGKWMHYDGRRWNTDNTLFAYNCARRMCRIAAKECNEEKPAKLLASAKTSSAIERLARADRKLAATNEQWDTDAWLLNTPAGVIDLRTGEVRSPSSADYMTKIASIGPGADCPIWKQHLFRIMGGDADLVAYLQRVFGYSLTGITREHALFFAYGKGANGKSVTINTIAGILGDYQRSAPIETFTASQTDRHPTELAGLQGARLVSSIETEEGRAWAESKIKALTGGDPIAARFMRQDFFEYSPQFKLFIAGNHRPALRSVDEAIRRRFQLIPFTVTIPPAERDETLTEQLKAEWPGILAWMIEGCLAWQRQGLNPPNAVLVATAEYLEGEDAILAWIEEACELGPQLHAKASDLYCSWTGWANSNGEHVGSSKRFTQSLEAHGFQRARTRAARGFIGLSIKKREAGVFEQASKPEATTEPREKVTAESMWA